MREGENLMFDIVTRMNQRLKYKNFRDKFNVIEGLQKKSNAILNYLRSFKSKHENLKNNCKKFQLNFSIQFQVVI